MEEHLSPAEILRNMGPLFKEYRLRYRLTQKTLSETTRISVTTISNFENGILTDINFSTLFKLLNAVNLDTNWVKLIPELPESPYLYKRNHKLQRIRNK